MASHPAGNSDRASDRARRTSGAERLSDLGASANPVSASLWGCQGNAETAAHDRLAATPNTAEARALDSETGARRTTDVVERPGEILQVVGAGSLRCSFGIIRQRSSCSCGVS